MEVSSGRQSRTDLSISGHHELLIARSMQVQASRVQGEFERTDSQEGSEITGGRRAIKSLVESVLEVAGD